MKKSNLFDQAKDSIVLRKVEAAAVKSHRRWDYVARDTGRAVGSRQLRLQQANGQCKSVIVMQISERNANQ